MTEEEKQAAGVGVKSMINRDIKDASLEKWYSPYKITYTYSQVTWLLENIRELREGIWPPNPDGGSSYTDPKIVNKSGEYKAYTENIGNVAGTLERWLLKTGMDGAMAYLRFTVGCNYSEVARMFHISEDEAYTRVNRAIIYCRDKGRKMVKSWTPKQGVVKGDKG